MNMDAKVAQIGLGSIGLGIARAIMETPGLALVSAHDISLSLVGLDLGPLVKRSSPTGITVAPPSTDAIKSGGARVVVLTTSTRVDDILEMVTALVDAGLSVLTTSEELAYPWKTHPEQAATLNQLAQARGVAVLSTGVNPGFLMDYLPLVMSGVTRNIRRVRAERYLDAGLRRRPFRKKVGVGLSLADFEQHVTAGDFGHAGLSTSITMLAAGLGIELDRVDESFAPVVAEMAYSDSELPVPIGHARGIRQIARGFKDDQELVTLSFQAAVGQDDPCDKVIIDGSPPVNLRLEGGTHGDTGTCAVVLNALQAMVREKRSGLLTMLDMVPFHGVLRADGHDE